MPYAVLEATAAGLPVLSTDVGDVKAMVSSENRSFVVPETRAAKTHPDHLIKDEGLRKTLGSANRFIGRRTIRLFDSYARRLRVSLFTAITTGEPNQSPIHASKLNFLKSSELKMKQAQGSPKHAENILGGQPWMQPYQTGEDSLARRKLHRLAMHVGGEKALSREQYVL